MNLSEIRDIIRGLDRAYENIDDEARQSRGAQAPDPAEHFFFRGAQPRESGTRATSRSATHGGAAPGFASDPLANALTQELSTWVRLARDSATARSLLHIDSIDSGDESTRFGTLLSLGSSLPLASSLSFDATTDPHVWLAASRDAVIPTDRGNKLWAPRATPQMSLRLGEARGDPWALDFDHDGRERRVSFSSVVDGYAEYLKVKGLTADERSLARLGDCPPPRLLATVLAPAAEDATSALSLAAGSGPSMSVAASTLRLREVERVPFGYAESWLSSERVRAAESLWSEPCEACQFGLGAWLHGHTELLQRVTPEARRAYEKLTAETIDFLRRDGSEVRRRQKPSEQKPSPRTRAAATAGTATAATGTATAATGTAPVTTGTAPTAIGTLPSTATGTLPTAATGSTDVAKSSVPGARPPPPGGGTSSPGSTDTATAASSAVAQAKEPAAPPPAPPPDSYRPPRREMRSPPEEQQRDQGGGQRRRERVRVRLESSGFPCDDVEIRELRGKEAISQLFSFHVDIICPVDTEISPDSALGADVDLVFEQGSTEVRRVHGMIAQIDDRLENESAWRSYRLWIVPHAWRSTLVESQEVYLDISVPDLIVQKLSMVGAEPEMRLLSTYPVREIITQYKESDLTFVSRLAEHLGIHFFFEHEGGSDKIVFSDDNSGFQPLQNLSEVQFRPRGEKIDIFELEARARAFPASFAVQDYNYRTPTVDLTGIHEAPQGLGGGVVEHGAHHKTPAEGALLARVRAEERAVQNRYYSGKSDVAELGAGGRFSLAGHPRLDGLGLIVVEVEHHALQTVKMQGADGGDEPYRNSFRAIDASLTFRPPRVTPRPKIHGLVTGLIQPHQPGDTQPFAKLDDQGRYLVRFLFDLAASPERKASHPVRMLQKHAGQGYGTHFPLKPGIEVLMAFVDGDPDRPLIVGAAHNPTTPSPVVIKNNQLHRMVTETAIQLVFKDA